MGKITCSLLVAMVCLFGGVSGAMPAQRLHWQKLHERVAELNRQRQYDAMLKTAIEALDVAEDSFAMAHPAIAVSTYDIAFAYDALGKYRPAETYYRRALTLEEDTLGPAHPETLKCLNNLAMVYIRTNRPDKAEPLLLRVIRTGRASSEPSVIAGVAVAAFNLAEQYSGQGRFDASEPLYEQSLSIADRKDTNVPLAPDYILYRFAFSLYRQRKGERAEILLKRALAIRDNASDPASPLTAQILNALATLYRSRHRYAQAVPLLRRRLQILEGISGAADPEVTDALMTLANTYHAQGNYILAESIFRRALDLRKASLGPNHPDVAEVLLAIGRVNNDQHRAADALKACNGALAIIDGIQGADATTGADARVCIAAAYLQQYKFDDGEAAFKQAIQLLRASTAQPTMKLAAALNGLGELYRSAGKYSDAEAPFSESLDIISRLAGRESEDYAMVLNNLGLLYKDQGRYAEAEPLHLRSLDIYEKRLGPENVEVAFPLNALASLFIAQDRLSEAEPLLRRALAIRETVYEADNPAVATLVNNLAVVYGKLGRYQEAAPLYRRALAFDEKALGPNHPTVGTDAGNLGRAYFRLNRFAEAETLLLRALRIADDSLGPDHPGTIHALENLGSFYYGRADYRHAEPFLDRALASVKRQFSYQFSYMSEKDRLSFRAAMENTFSLYLSFCFRFKGQRPALAGKMYDLALWNKGLIARSISSLHRRVAASGDTQAVALMEQISSRKTHLASLQMVPPADSRTSREDILTLEKEINDLETKLVRRSPVYSEREYLAGITWRDIAKKLQGDEAAIELLKFHYRDERGYTGESYYVAMVLSGASSTEPQVIWLGKAADIEGAPFKDYRELVEAGAPPDEEAGKTFYEAAWRPLDQSLSGIKRIYLSPAGLFNEVSWGVVPAADEQLLIEKYDIQLLLSTRDLMRSPHASVGRSAVLAGAPDFDLTEIEQLNAANKIRSRSIGAALNIAHDRRLRSGVHRGSPLEPLAGAKRELQTLRSRLKRHGWQVTLYTGPDALEENIKTLKPARLLHIATHGFFAADENHFFIDSPLVENAVFDEPMLRSMLYFAGANRALSGNPPPVGLDDGVLTAYEASDLSLSGTELVVLSACETGLGITKNAEGVFGLRRALQEAGVDAVLMSLWKIPDRDTEELMALFYEGWLTGATKQAALREAQLEMRERVRSRRGGQDVPYYWGAFVLVGR